jgi:hypothetical protein
VCIVTPEDTQSLRDIQLDAQSNAPPCYAVQLVLSTSPVEITDYPHLAIFDAYSLYSAAGTRHGEPWHALRLGFFKSPDSATQVAYYVRSEYPAVAVVPVAQKERDSAEPVSGVADELEASFSQKPRRSEGSMQGFELLQDDRPAPSKRDVDDPPARAGAAPGAKPAFGRPGLPRSPTAPVAAGKRAMVRNKPGQANLNSPGVAKPMDETFDALGAGTLSIDDGREIVGDTRTAKVGKKSAASGGRFSRLLSRLGGS